GRRRSGWSRPPSPPCPWPPRGPDPTWRRGAAARSAGPCWSFAIRIRRWPSGWPPAPPPSPPGPRVYWVHCVAPRCIMIASTDEKGCAMGLTLGVDIGGTKVLAAVVDEEGRVLAQARRDSPADDVGRMLERVVEVITELLDAHEVE